MLGLDFTPKGRLMNSASSQIPRLSGLLWTFSVVLIAISIAGCGRSQSAVGNTSVTLVVSSTANDKLSMFQMDLIDLTLTSQSGETVSLLASPPSTKPSEYVEFLHVNGTAEPLVTVSIPQGIYTAAALTFGDVQFECEPNPSTGDGTDSATIGGFGIPSTQVPVVASPTPIKISGTAMGLSLDLQVSKSIQFNSCPSIGAGQYFFAPTFTLTPVPLSSQPTNAGNGKLIGLTGLISSVDRTESSITITSADGPVWSAVVGTSTVLQGVAGISSLIAGMPVNMDVAIQADGALLATRVEVDDPNTTDLSVSSGPLVSVLDSQQTLWFVSTLDQGLLYSKGFAIGSRPYTYYNSSAVFQISGQLSNLQSLPFTPSFTATNMVPGQNVSLTSHTLNSSGYYPLTTVTLIPQTLDGAVTAISSQGSFTIYTVTLASYDLFPILAVQAGQNTLLANPESVVVYVDNNTQMLNSGMIGVGYIMRFSGLIFNDNGTLRMDCAQVNDGVAE
jgi:hypothetical protein